MQVQMNECMNDWMHEYQDENKWMKNEWVKDACIEY